MLRRDLVLGAGALVLPATLPPRRAAAQTPAPPPAFHRTRIGDVEVVVLSDGAAGRPDVTQGFVLNAPAEEVRALLAGQGIAPTGLRNPYNPTLLRRGADVVLIDTGRGGAGGGVLFDSMRAAGIEPEEVTVVLLSHFHGDHVGGMLAADGTATFRNARVLAPERELAFWNDEGEESRASAFRRPGFAFARRCLAPYAGRIAPFARDAEVLPGLRSVATPGHSPGHVSFLLADGTRQLMVMGDVVGAAELFLPMPAWQPMLDMDPALAAETRMRLLDRLAADRIEVIAFHWPMPSTGRVERAGAGYRFIPAA
ncbi:MBL fold metallo-hydrolase [Falsiroseomonas sp. HW251]|uniref:MBL fold metallo-hydrolase n=1 Tax=Falsiroseomonas sp. HW251 TaxID=3390998 RepID=UPI003D319844